MVIKTEAQWAYQPADFFEAPFNAKMQKGELHVEAGKATYRLSTPVEPIPDDMREHIGAEVSAFFRARQLITHKSFKLEGPSFTQYQSDGGKCIKVLAQGSFSLSRTSPIDLIQKDAAGNVIADTKQARIKSETSFVSSLASKLLNSDTLLRMVQSYSQAVQDPDNELIHLYEVRDAMANHYKGNQKARKTLGISESDWKLLGRLANDKPLLQGRHRGQMSKLRNATSDELNTARRIARLIIEAFAEKV